MFVQPPVTRQNELASHIMNNLYWMGTSHEFVKPYIDLPMGLQKPTLQQTVQTKQIMVTYMVENSLDWFCLVYAVFENDNGRTVQCFSLIFDDMNLLEMGSCFNQVIEVGIRKSAEANGNNDICLNDIKYYTYFIAPADIYDFDQMENQYLDILVQKDTKYKWKARLKVTPKNFIDSIADVSFG